jgi:hypothetical protein
MKSKLLAMTALCIGLVAAAPLALAQSTQSIDASPLGGGAAGTNQSAGSNGGEDAPNYMTGPGIHLFYSDETMSTLRSGDEIRTVYGGLSAEDQLMLRQSCASNEDTRFAELCSAVGTF